MAFLHDFLATEVVRTPITFGIQDNVRLVRIDNTPRKNNDGVVQPTTCFLFFEQYNEKNIVVASKEFSYFTLKAEDDEQRKMESFSTQMAQLQNLVDILAPGVELDPAADVEDEAELSAIFADKKKLRAFQDNLYDIFATAVTNKIGKESTLLRIKVVVDKKGYPRLTSDTIMAEDMEATPVTAMAMSAYENKIKLESLSATTTAKPDAKTPVRKGLI